MDLTQRAAALLRDSDELADSLVDTVWEHVPGYEPTRLDREELAAVVGPNLRTMLTALAEDRRPGGRELRAAEALGERRAAQGVPVEAVVASWHAAERVLLLRLLVGEAAVAPEVLLNVSGRLAAVIDTMVEASTVAHRRTRAEMGSHLEHVESDLVSRLAAGEPLDPAEVEERARLIGVEPQRPHRCIAAALTGDGDPALLGRAHRTLVDHLRPHVDGRVLSGTHQGALLVVVPDFPDAPARLEGVMHRSELPERLVVGLGDPRPRLGEAAASCREALAALRVGVRLAVRRSLVAYRSVIPEVLLEENPLASRKLVDATLGALLPHPRLVQTLSVYLATGLSVRLTADQLSVHENTVAYRMRRVVELMECSHAADLVRPDVLMSLRALALLPEGPPWQD